MTDRTAPPVGRGPRGLRGTLYFRFLAVLVPVQAAILIAMAALFLSSQQAASDEEMLRDRTQTVRHVSVVLSQDLVESNYEGAERFLQTMTAETDILRCELYDAEGMLLFGAGRPGVVPPEVPAGLFTDARDRREDVYVRRAGSSVVHMAVPILVGGRVRGVAIITLSTEAQEQRIAALRNRLALAAIAFILAGVVVAIALARHVARPVSELALAAGRLAAGDYDLSIGTSRDDEIGALAAAFDRMVANLRTAHRDLEVARADVERILESMPDAVLVADFESVGGCVITRANSAAATLLGWTQQELAARPLASVVRGEDELRAELVALHGAALLRDRNVVYVSRSGTTIDVRLSASRMRGEGRAHSYVLVASDVREVRALESQLHQSQKMEAVGLLAGGVAHDFNNLLSVILGYGELLRGKLHDTGSVTYLDMITEAGDRATKLVAHLLAFSRRRVIEPQPLDLRTTVSDMQKMLRRIIREDIELVAELPEALDAVETDPGQIEQVLLNLAVNARDAMPSGGRLTIHLENLVIDEAGARHTLGLAPGRHVVLLFSDTGVGMTPEVRDHAFEPFFTTKERGRGTGLGLATVYGVVQQARGHISIETEVGRGTTFRIFFPSSTRTAADTRRCLPSHDSGTGTETILVVEDEPALRSFVVCILKDRGYMVLDASDGLAALEVSRLHSGTIDLLLTDVVMPRMGGPALAKTLSTERPGLGVLYMSGYTDGALTEQGVLDAEVQLVQKPFTSAKLLTRVRQRLDKPAARVLA